MSVISVGQAGVLGIAEGGTEFLPVPSTVNLKIAEGPMGIPADDASAVRSTAVIRVGPGAPWAADRTGRHKRGEDDTGLKDAMPVGRSRIPAPLLPGFSRSGATMSTRLVPDLDRGAATRLSTARPPKFVARHSRNALAVRRIAAGALLFGLPGNGAPTA